MGVFNAGVRGTTVPLVPLSLNAVSFVAASPPRFCSCSIFQTFCAFVLRIFSHVMRDCVLCSVVSFGTHQQGLAFRECVYCTLQRTAKHFSRNTPTAVISPSPCNLGRIIICVQ